MEYILLNGLVVFLGAFISRFLSKILSKELVVSMLKIVNLSVVLIGIQGAIVSQKPILMLLSVIIGGLIGTFLNIEKQFDKLGSIIKNTFKKSNDDFVTGFVTVLMITCIGSLAIIGPLNMGLSKDPTILIYKSVIDGITAIIYGTMYGHGVMFSSFGIILYQGLIFLLAKVIAPYLTPSVITEISAVGSLLVMGLGFKLLEMLDIKIANYLPAIFIPLIYYLITQVFNLNF